MDKTYAEVSGKVPMDWNKTLDEAISNGVSNREYLKLCELSQSWVTCACGNTCAIIPRTRMGRPDDIELENLGDGFHHAVCKREWLWAKEILAKIEERADTLIKREIEKINQSLVN